MPSTRLSLLRCFSLLVVGLLLPLASSTESTLCKDREMACFVNGKCSNPNEDDDLTKTSQDLTDCDVSIQIRPYSTSHKKALIRLKTKTKAIKLSYADSPTAYFGCELDTTSGKGVLFTGEDPPTELLNSNDKGGIYCEFIHELELSKQIMVHYGSGTDVKNMAASGMINPMSMAPFIKCDMDTLKNEFTDQEDQMVYLEADRRFSKVACKSGTLAAMVDGGVVKGPIECGCPDAPATCTADKLQYQTSQSNKKVTVVGCEASGCLHASKCKEVPCTGEKCPKIDKVKSCNTLKCPGKDGGTHIKINNEAATLEKVTCAQAENDKWTQKDAKFRWMLKETPVKTVECIDPVPCKDKGKAHDDGAPFACDVGTINITKNDGTSTAGKVSCDGKTGHWKNDAGADVVVACVLPVIDSTTDGTPAAAGALGTAEYASLGVGGIVILIGIGFLVYCFAIKPKKNKEKNKKNIKAIASSTSKQEIDPGLKTALPVGYLPPTTGTSKSNSDHGQPIKVEVELVEKTAQTPGTTKMMNTAVLNPTTPTEDQREDFDKEVSQGLPAARVINPGQPRSQSDGSEPRSVKIGKNGEDYLNAKKLKLKEKKSDEKSSQSEAGTTKKAEKPAKPADLGPKPQVFPLNEKEEKIRMGATCKANQYPTLADVDSEWDEWDSAKARAAGNVEAGKKPRKDRGKTKDHTKTVPTPVTPENPDAKPSVERTQATNTRHTRSVDYNNDPDDIGNLVTQLDTTMEQKEADSKKSHK